MKTVIWLSALSVIISVASAITLCGFFYYPDSKPWLAEHSGEIMRQVNAMTDIEELRNATLNLVAIDQAQNSLANRTLQLLVVLATGLLALLGSLASYSCVAAWNAATAQRAPLARPAAPATIQT